MRFFSVKMPAMRHPGQKTRMKQRRLHTNQSIVPDKAVCLHRQWGICCNLGKLLQSFRLDTAIDLFSLPKWGKAKRVSQHLPRFGLWWLSIASGCVSDTSVFGLDGPSSTTPQEPWCPRSSHTKVSRSTASKEDSSSISVGHRRLQREEDILWRRQEHLLILVLIHYLQARA